MSFVKIILGKSTRFIRSCQTFGIIKKTGCIVNILIINILTMVTLHSSLPMILHCSLDRIMPVYRELFAKYDLTEQQWRILRVLWDTEEISSGILAKQALLPKPSLVGILDRLEKRGLVERRRSTQDRRNVSIVSTSKGMALAKEVLPQAEAIHRHIRGQLTEDMWITLEGALDTLNSKMRSVSLADITPQNLAEGRKP